MVVQWVSRRAGHISDPRTPREVVQMGRMQEQRTHTRLYPATKMQANVVL
jgi:hypothetical protein